MKLIILTGIITILCIVYCVGLYKREINRNKDRKARNAARDQAWLIDQRNKK